MSYEHICSAEDTQIWAITNENINQGMSDDSKTPKEKLHTKEKCSRSLPRNAIGNKIADVYDSWSDPDTLLTLKQHLMNINETCSKVAPSDEASFIQRQIKQNNTTKNQLVLTYQFQNKINRHLQEDWVNRNKKITICNQFTSKEDIGKYSWRDSSKL